MTTRVTVLGASGHAGRELCRLLLAEGGFDVLACGRTEDRLHRVVADLGSTGREHVDLAVVDVEKDDERLLHAIQSSDIVVGATSRADHAHLIARRAVESGVSYLGLYMSSPGKWVKLRQMQETCTAKGVSVVDDGGVHPGVPGALVRLAAARNNLNEAWVGGKFDVTWRSLDLTCETIDDFLSEIREADLSVFKEGRWVKGFRHSRSFDFGEPVGTVSCIPMCMEEVRELPGMIDGLASTGFFIAGFGPVIDYVVFPLSAVLGVVSRRAAARLLWWGLKRFQSAEQIGVVSLEATSSDGEAIRYRISHADPYVLTVVPAMAAILQMRDGVKPGVWTQAAFVEPEQFVRDLDRLGLDVQLSR